MATNAQFAGKEAGSISLGYVMVGLDGKHWGAHRIIWALHCGKPSAGDIDHINGNPSDNRISNLREVTRSENMRNQKVSTTNKSGHRGVYFLKSVGAWRAAINDGGRKVPLGQFRDMESALAARKAAEARLGYVNRKSENG